MIPHFTTNLCRYKNIDLEPPRKYLYCGNCLSFNLKTYEGKGVWNDIVYEGDKCVCLDCEWKGDYKTCKHLSKSERENKDLDITRKNKIEKIIKIYESRRTS